MCDRNENSIIQHVGEILSNNIYMKREDLLPYSFGGNKARKGKLFFDEIDRGYDHVVTYGSSHSNHCRIISNMAAARGIECDIISPLEDSEATYNSRLMKIFGANITQVPVDRVHHTIEERLRFLVKSGKRPYFIPGGGHGNLGTEAYVQCYKEIKNYEEQKSIFFDFIFLASGTGTTQAGLVCGQLMNRDVRKIIGVSIARRIPRGRDIVVDSIREYLSDRKWPVSENDIQEKTVFVDDYVGLGYGKGNTEILNGIKEMMMLYGVPMDSTYTGKAFYGMKDILQKKEIVGKKILFIHTGGTPLFFDDLKQI